VATRDSGNHQARSLTLARPSRWLAAIPGTDLALADDRSVRPFTLFTWAPYLLLGPILARTYLGGAAAWGIISAGYAAGSVLTGLGLVGRRPRRLLVVAVLGTFGSALPCLLLALRAPEPAVAAGALLAGAGSATSGPGRVLAFAAAYATVSSAAVLAVPAIWSVRWQEPPEP